MIDMSHDPLLAVIRDRTVPTALRDLALAVYDLPDDAVEHQRVRAAARLYVLSAYPQASRPRGPVPD